MTMPELFPAGKVTAGGGEEVWGHIWGWPHQSGARARPTIAGSGLATVAGGGSVWCPHGGSLYAVSAMAVTREAAGRCGWEARHGGDVQAATKRRQLRAWLLSHGERTERQRARGRATERPREQCSTFNGATTRGYEVGSMMEHECHAARASRAGRPCHPPNDSIQIPEAKDWNTTSKMWLKTQFFIDHNSQISLNWLVV
jgi:hypothetical protein